MENRAWSLWRSRCRPIGAPVILAFILMVPCSLKGQIWNVDANGNWTTAANWSPATDPNGVNVAVTFGNVITANRTVTLNANRTVGSVTFNDNNNYLLQNNTLTLDVSAGSAAITVNNSNGDGAHTITN
jgi:hypothetical protein